MNEQAMTPARPAHIAVASQNRRTVTNHAGRCRRFQVFDASGTQMSDIELRPDQVLQAAQIGPDHPLAGIEVLIASSMGAGLVRRLRRAGTICYLSNADTPAAAVADLLAGKTSAIGAEDARGRDSNHDADACDHAHCNSHDHGQRHGRGGRAARCGPHDRGQELHAPPSKGA